MRFRLTFEDRQWEFPDTEQLGDMIQALIHAYDLRMGHFDFAVDVLVET